MVNRALSCLVVGFYISSNQSVLTKLLKLSHSLFGLCHAVSLHTAARIPRFASAYLYHQLSPNPHGYCHPSLYSCGY